MVELGNYRVYREMKFAVDSGFELMEDGFNSTLERCRKYIEKELEEKQQSDFIGFTIFQEIESHSVE